MKRNKEINNIFDGGVWGCDCQKNVVITNKRQKFQTDLHYSDPTANKERTVFGEPKGGLFYNYSDRLFGERWQQGWDQAMKQSTPQTAEFFEIVLNCFHQTNTVNLRHVVLGCNRSNGYSYLIFGYTY